MDFMQILASCVLLAVVLANDNNSNNSDRTEKRSGMLGQNVKLSCEIPLSDPPKVKWYDIVHNINPDPILIFSSEDDLSDSHPNKAAFKVDRKNFDLRISNLTFGDVGEYFCESEKDSKTFKKRYYLTVHKSMNCSGKTNLNDGQPTDLSCFVFYSGDLPPLKWFQGDREVNSTDLSGIDEEIQKFVVRKNVHLRATHELDKQTLRCNLGFSDKPEDCPLVFNVTYLARDLMFSSKGDTLYVGEALSCTARGNPEPTIHIALVTTSVPEAADKRRKSQIIVSKSWEGKNITFECTAANTVGGESKPLKESRSYRVVAVTTTSTTTTTTPKPNHPANPSANVGETSSGARFASWIMFHFASISFTLAQLNGVRRC